MTESIPVAGPWITEKEVAYVADAARNNWYGGAGTYEKRFEEFFAAHCGRKYAVSLPHCTAGIHLSLLALGVGPGDEVIVPDATWIASSAPISYVGATPVFADIDAATWCLAPSSFEQCITPRTKAVIVVDLYGCMPAMDEILRIAGERGIPVIEDAAEAVGSRSGGKPAGSFGVASVFSFHGSKTVVTGEGGMLVTDDEALYRRILFLRDHGRQPGDRMFRNTEVAYKEKMSGLQAACGLAQMERLAELVGKKREIFSWYREGLSDIEGITLNPEPQGTVSSYWMSTVVLAPERGIAKEDLMEQLEAKKIHTRPFFHPLSSLPAYEGSKEVTAARERNAVSYRLCPFGINLPSALSLTREQVAYVCECLSSFLHA